MCLREKILDKIAKGNISIGSWKCMRVAYSDWYLEDLEKVVDVALQVVSEHAKQEAKKALDGKIKNAQFRLAVEKFVVGKVVSLPNYFYKRNLRLVVGIGHEFGAGAYFSLSKFLKGLEGKKVRIVLEVFENGS